MREATLLIKEEENKGAHVWMTTDETLCTTNKEASKYLDICFLYFYFFHRNIAVLVAIKSNLFGLIVIGR